jgi:hypothetical protein
MNQKAYAILLKLLEALGKNEWIAGTDWKLNLKADGNIPLSRMITAVGSIDGDKWQDQIQTLIRLTTSTEDEWTFFPEFTVYAQVAIGSLPSKDVAYKMIGNEAFMEKDIKDDKKFISAAREITRMVEAHINEVYQDYVDENEDLIRYFKQGLSEHGMPKSSWGA